MNNIERFDNIMRSLDYSLPMTKQFTQQQLIRKAEGLSLGELRDLVIFLQGQLFSLQNLMVLISKVIKTGDKSILAVTPTLDLEQSLQLQMLEQRLQTIGKDEILKEVRETVIYSYLQTQHLVQQMFKKTLFDGF